MRELLAALVIALSLGYVPVALAAGPSVVGTAPSGVNNGLVGGQVVGPQGGTVKGPSTGQLVGPQTGSVSNGLNPAIFIKPPAPNVIILPPPPPPPSAFPGLGQVNPNENQVSPGSTPPFQTGVPNPFNNPHPMLPWGPGQISGERYGQVLRYWANQPQTVDNVIIVVGEEATPTESQPQGQPGGGPAQGALDARVAAKPRPQSVEVPGSYIAETTRGYVHMPRWALQEIGGGRYQWVLIGAWFQPK